MTDSPVFDKIFDKDMRPLRGRAGIRWIHLLGLVPGPNGSAAVGIVTQLTAEPSRSRRYRSGVCRRPSMEQEHGLLVAVRQLKYGHFVQVLRDRTASRGRRQSARCTVTMIP